MGSLLLAAGEPGMRRCLPNAQVMLHQPSGAFCPCASRPSRRVASRAASERARASREKLRPTRGGGRTKSSVASMASRDTHTHRRDTKKNTGGAQGQAADIAIVAKEILKTREKLNKIYVSHTGKDVEAIERVMDRDTYFTAEEAKEFGVVDEVVAARERPGPPRTTTRSPSSARLEVNQLRKSAVAVGIVQ